MDTKPKKLHSIREFAQYFDHTLLRPEATPADIKRLCDEAIKWGFYAVCVNPSMVSLVMQNFSRDRSEPGNVDKVRICSVVGFPLGAMVTDLKVAEAKRAVDDGADEIDMVISLGFYLSKDKYSQNLCRNDITEVVKALGKTPVKVILETAFLRPDEILELSQWCVDAGAAFVKTSTGFGPRGASTDDIKAMSQVTVNTGTRIKASGGIKDLNSVLSMIDAGAHRIGSSQSAKIIEEFKSI